MKIMELIKETKINTNTMAKLGRNEDVRVFLCIGLEEEN